MILVCGEALFDMFATETSSGFSFEAHAAGSPFNVAVGISRLGAPSSLLTGVSKDFLGRKLVQRLEEEGVSTAHLHHLDAPTTTAYVSLADDRSATYAFYGEGAADRSLSTDIVVDPNGVEGLHFGSYSFVTGSSGDLYLSLMRNAGTGRFISYDPNVRPTVEPDMDVWRRRLGEAAPHCDLIKMSDEDAGFLFPDTALPDICRRLLEAGARCVTITKGADGAVLFTKDFMAEAPTAASHVVDTVGAGDSFQAAFLASLYRTGCLGRDGIDEPMLRRALNTGLVAAAITCGRTGANLPNTEELDWEIQP